MNYLKKSLLFVLLFISTGAFSQLEAKFDALGTIIGMPAIKAEYIINENISAELSFDLRFGKPFIKHSYYNIAYNSVYKQSGGGIKLESRYYLSPDYSADRFYLGLYLRIQSISKYYEEAYDSAQDEYVEEDNIINHKFSSVGLVLGYKYFFDSGLTFDYGVGLGRSLSNSVESSLFGQIDSKSNFDYYFAFGVGYRFDWGEEKKEDTDFEEF